MPAQTLNGCSAGIFMQLDWVLSGAPAPVLMLDKSEIVRLFEINKVSSFVGKHTCRTFLNTTKLYLISK